MIGLPADRQAGWRRGPRALRRWLPPMRIGIRSLSLEATGLSALLGFARTCPTTRLRRQVSCARDSVCLPAGRQALLYESGIGTYLWKPLVFQHFLGSLALAPTVASADASCSGVCDLAKRLGPAGKGLSFQETADRQQQRSAPAAKRDGSWPIQIGNRKGTQTIFPIENKQHSGFDRNPLPPCRSRKNLSRPFMVPMSRIGRRPRSQGNFDRPK
jgi:hypothetical protein